MDWQTGAICVGLVILSVAVLLVVSVFAIKETTYEEAIAEQRKMPEGALLLRRPGKEKSKDKKPKRLGKKVKEKKKEIVTRQSSTETDDQNVSENEHPHVTIVPDAVVIGEAVHPIVDDKKKKKKEKVKPILINREKIAPGTIHQEPPATENHFEVTVPKDDLSLRKLSKSEKTVDEESIEFFESPELLTENPSGDSSEKEGADKKTRNDSKSGKAEKSAKPEKVKEMPVKAEDSVSSSSTPVDSSPVQQSKAAKEKKKNKKSDIALQQMPGDVNLQLLSTLIRKAELSRNEVQSLTDILLNKHLDDRVDHSDWIEGRQDPVVKLKKQLAEKEEALANESASSLAFQNKLKELRAELNAERSKLAQACRTYEDGLVVKQSELQTVQTRLHQQTMLFDSEKQALHQKIQQLNLQVKEDGLMIRKLQENNQAQGALQQELLNNRQQIQQMEVHIARLSEAENTLKGQFHAAMNERDQLSGSYSQELQKSRRLEDELREALGKLETAKDASLEHHELSRQFEDIERAKKDAERKMNEALQTQEEINFEKTRLQGEIHQLTNKVSELQADISKLGKEAQAEKSRLQTELTAANSKLAETAADVDQLNREREKVNSTAEVALADTARVVEENKNLLDEVAFFKQEKERLTAELTAASSFRTPADGRENDTKDINKQFINNETASEKRDVLVEKLKADVAEKEKLVEKLRIEISSYTTELTNLNGEVAKFKTEISSLIQQLDAQKSKNNDLRQKNWKAVDALSIAEKALESKVKETDKLVDAQVKQICIEEQQISKELLERLFPEVKTAEKDYKKWVSSFESLAQKYLSELKTVSLSPPVQNGSGEKLEELEEQNSQLQTLVTHYKGIIVDTEGMLNKLQKHIEEEEIRWGDLLETKQAEVDTLKKEHSTLLENLKSQAAHEGIQFAYNCVEKALPALLNQLQEKIKVLEEDLADVKEERDSKVQELTDLLKQINHLRDEVTALKEKLATVCNEKDTLQSTLNGELERIKELNKDLVKLRSNLKIGQDSYEAEHKIRLELEEQIKAMGCRASGDSSADIISAEANVELPSSPEPPAVAVKKKGKKQKRPKPRKSNWGLPEWFRKVRSSSRKSKRKQPSAP